MRNLPNTTPSKPLAAQTASKKLQHHSKATQMKETNA
jgi:hypothetical protein